MDLILAILLVVLVLGFVFSNGVNDSAPVVAAVISSGAMGPRQALLAAAMFEFAGAFLLGTAVAKMLGTGLIQTSAVSTLTIIMAVISATLWNLLALYRAVPTSSSHALLGGLVGAAVASGGFASVMWLNLLKLYQVLVAAPIIGFGLAFVLTRILLSMLRRVPPTLANRQLLRLQPWAAFGLAMSHGSISAQSGMGLITMGLVLLHLNSPDSLQLLYQPSSDGLFSVPSWVVAVCALAIAAGMATGGWRIIRTLGGGLYRIRPIHGFTSQLGSAGIVYLSAIIGFPVSTTQIASSSIIGAGAGQRMNAVRWTPVQHMVIAWVITIPCAAALSAGLTVSIGWLLGSVIAY
jgi:inorganic phosphate transporter, PiT family